MADAKMKYIVCLYVVCLLVHPEKGPRGRLVCLYVVCLLVHPELFFFVCLFVCFFFVYEFCTTPGVYTRVKPPSHAANKKAAQNKGTEIRVRIPKANEE